MFPSLDVGNTTKKTEIAPHLFIYLFIHRPPTDAILTIIDPNQPKPQIKLPISIRQDSLQYHTSVLIDSPTTLNFVSKDFLTRNSLLGKCIRGPQIVVRFANEQRISTSNTFSLTHVLLGHKMFIGLSFIMLLHFKCANLSLLYQQQKS